MTKLFVPRKQYPTIPPNADPEMRTFLTEILRQHRVNDLAIQHWANQGALSSGVHNSVVQNWPGDALFHPIVFNTSDWDFWNFVNLGTSSLMVPERGIYLISFGGQWLGLPAGSVVDIQLLPGGVVTDTRERPTGGYQNMEASVSRIYGAKAALTLQGRVQPAPPPATVTFQLWEFTATKIFDIPSKPQ